MSKTPHTRWMLNKDLDEVCEIEQLCFQFPWPKSDFVRTLRQRNCIGMTAELSERVVGYMVYELHPRHLRLHNFAVLPAMQRRGIGSALVEKLVSKLTPERRNTISIAVRETNLDGLLFFKALGFQAVNLFRDYYQDCTDDAIAMEYRLRVRKAVETA